VSENHESECDAYFEDGTLACPCIKLQKSELENKTAAFDTLPASIEEKNPKPS